MWKINDLFRGIFQNEKVMFSPSSVNGNIDASNSIVANNVEIKEYNFHLDITKQLEEIYETALNKDSSIEFKEKIIPIEKLITDGKSYLAINEYEKLIESDKFINYINDEKFLVYNGLLNCYINLEADENIINKWSIKIDALGEDIKEIHRYYFLLSIWEYNNKRLEKAIILNEKAVKAKGDYFNALAWGILLRATNKDISYIEGKMQLDKLLKNAIIEIKDKATIYASLGDLAFNYRDFDYAQENYIKSNEFIKSLPKEIAIAVCEYFKSVKEIEENEMVTLDKIDFIQLEKARVKLEEIYENRNIDTLHLISRLIFPYLFCIFSITNKHKRILDIQSECMKFVDLSKPDILKYVVEAEIINGIYNEETFNYLNNYEKVKYKSFYYEIKKDYESEINLLVPVLENEYQNDKILQLALLNALIEDSQDIRYIHYYKKFNKDNNDEILWMNYIHFLDKRNEKDKVIQEIKEIKRVVNNSLVIYDIFVLLLDYNLSEELDEFFQNIDTGKYQIIGFQMPFILYNRLMYLLKNEKYEDFFNEYENSNLEMLLPISKAILGINYYTFKGDLDNEAKAYFELFKIDGNYNNLIKAVELKLSSNSLYDAEFYLGYVEPFKLEKPELYYIYYSIVLKEKGYIEQAFEKLKEIKEYVKNDLDSQFHQYYTAFCMNNGRTDDAFIYMAEYYSKNHNPKWFKVLQHSENESGQDLLNKLEDMIGGKRDLSHINSYFVQGIIGITVYNKLVGTGIEEILLNNYYPFTNVQISDGNIYNSIEDVKKIDDKILLDANTLAILSEVGALSLLDSFKEVLIPYNAITIVKERQSGIIRNSSNNILDYVNKSVNIKEVPVDIRIKLKTDSKQFLPEDTLDCIALSKYLKVPFLNTEVYASREFDTNYMIDINTFFQFLKQKKPSIRILVALTIANLRKYKAEFISFDANDIFICYQDNGIEGIKPFLRMGKNADYKSFALVYVEVLKRIKDEISVEDFEKVSIEFIKFVDIYIGKMRYNMYSVSRSFPEVKDDFEKLIKNCSIRIVLSMNKIYRLRAITQNIYSQIIQSSEFIKLFNVAIAFVSFVVSYLAMFKEDKLNMKKYIKLIKDNLLFSTDEDIDYIVELIRYVEEKEGK